MGGLTIAKEAFQQVTERPSQDAAFRDVFHRQPLAALQGYDLTDEERRNLPVPDFMAPTLDQLIRAVAAIERCRAGGRPTAVHCGAGLGRTGTVLAGALVARGLPAAAAIARVRAARPGSIETPEQVAVVPQYERHLTERRMEQA